MLALVSTTIARAIVPVEAGRTATNTGPASAQTAAATIASRTMSSRTSFSRWRRAGTIVETSRNRRVGKRNGVGGRRPSRWTRIGTASATSPNQAAG